jgi:hypothetical protein
MENNTNIFGSKIFYSNFGAKRERDREERESRVERKSMKAL